MMTTPKLIGVLLLGGALAQIQAAAALRGMVTAQGDQLIEHGKPFRFISFNIPNLICVEDNVAFTAENPWRWPDRFETEAA